MRVKLESQKGGAPKLLWLACLITSLTVVFFQLPLSWLSGLVAAQTGCRVLLDQPMGTIWKGSSALAFSEPNIGAQGCREPVAVTERFHWTSACQLVGMSCQSEIQFATLEKPQIILWDTQQIRLQENSIQLPTNLLEAMGNPWKTLRPRGSLGVRWTNIQFQGFFGGGNPKKAGSGVIRITIENLSSSISPIKPLGSYEIQANLDNAGINWTLMTNSGPLLLKGNGEIGMSSSEKGMVFSGDASAAPDDQESLIGLLSLLGKKEGNVYRLKL